MSTKWWNSGVEVNQLIILVVTTPHACSGACNPSNPPIIVEYFHLCFNMSVDFLQMCFTRVDHIDSGQFDTGHSRQVVF